MYTKTTYDMFMWKHDQLQGKALVPPEREGDPPVAMDVELEVMCFLNTDEALQNGYAHELQLAFTKGRLAEFLAWASQFLDVDGRQMVREALQLAGGVVPVKAEVQLPLGVRKE